MLFMRVAIIADWLVSYAGGERVIEELLKLYPDADLFSTVDFFPEEHRHILLNKKAQTTFIQNLPFAKSKYRNYLPLMPFAVEQLDLSSYDLVISSSSAVAKGVITGPEQVHICYCHSPIRYAWDLQHQYLQESGLDKGLKGWLARRLLYKIRLWDVRTSNGVDHFVSNSQFISKRIWKVYRRESTVIYPPVDINRFSLRSDKEDFYVTASRMVPYKKINIIVEAFSAMPDRKLIVVGSGPDFDKIKEIAGDNVELLGYQDSDVLCDLLQRAKAFIFAAMEDFGIAPVEAQACGTPVIAYGKGGACESIRGLDHDEPTGLFFHKQSPEAIVEAIKVFESNLELFSPQNCRDNASRFSQERFRESFLNFANKEMSAVLL
ncbi:hypothetical protein SCG7109_AR_00030 [Chlamydiales bacterium SCGC AG-110-M15]|nr:hypothetical protein SCG7109_AR_00030 [Chlamydiales bacterium SCGC AG-110-M15]